MPPLAEDDDLKALNQRIYELFEQEKYQEAIPELRKERLKWQSAVRGLKHPDTAISLSNLGKLYREMDEYAKAEPLLTRSPPDPAEGPWVRTSMTQ